MFHGAFPFSTIACSADKNQNSCLRAVRTCNIRNQRARSRRHHGSCDKCHLLLISNKDSIFFSLVPAVYGDKRRPSASINDLQVVRAAPRRCLRCSVSAAAGRAPCNQSAHNVNITQLPVPGSGRVMMPTVDVSQIH